ncbi:hypothetical protein MFIFM68171_07378 [Madurella fahalii]|uniref:AIG1-type G domain-containing protein n=1 Tax=Madurella fahalii TaxID=1157608 RepID=A0ABQ0GHC8_9PEZI
MPYPADTSIVIAVMGVTGSGKSSFIRGITSNDNVRVGLGLRSETSEIQAFKLRTSSRNIDLVDTPGFDDTERPDFEILEKLVDWVLKCSTNGQCLAGILLLHPITHNRFQGSSRRMLSTFKKLLGDDYFQKVLLVTTFWNDVQPSIGEQREKELLDLPDAWKPMIKDGARIERMGRDYDRFIPLLEGMAASPGPQLLVQKELSQGKSLDQTMAGLSLKDNMPSEQDHHQEEQRAKAKAQVSSHRVRSQDAINPLKARLISRLEDEIIAQRLENDQIMAQIRERDRQQDALREQKRRELEEQRRTEQEIREAQSGFPPA